MKLFNYRYNEDYGHEWYFQLLSIRFKFALVNLILQWDEFPSPEIFPLLLISFGSRSLTGFSFQWKWFQLRCDLLTTCPSRFE
jgi:hypothetical protein